ncbi:hypothetical protein LL912_02360 [Niabella sp. CC-SYL272]|nr:hypothetical protein [Niabella agricola]MCF3107613.1 hypothetical protein [Niabella agricola]
MVKQTGSWNFGNRPPVMWNFCPGGGVNRAWGCVVSANSRTTVPEAYPEW